MLVGKGCNRKGTVCWWVKDAIGRMVCSGGYRMQ